MPARPPVLRLVRRSSTARFPIPLLLVPEAVGKRFDGVETSNGDHELGQPLLQLLREPGEPGFLLARVRHDLAVLSDVWPWDLADVDAHLFRREVQDLADLAHDAQEQLAL